MTQAIYSEPSGRIIEELSRRLGQGVLLTGPVGIGLGFSAHAIARAHTKEIVTIEPDAKGTISIDTIRNLYTLGKSKGGTIIFIINDADAMGREAQNALLKLLEEPVSSLHFIVTTHAPDRLLQTIRSRVPEYTLVPLSTTQSTQFLSTLGVTDPTKRAQLLFIADGLPAALTQYAGDEKMFSDRSLTIRDARSFLQGSREERLLLSANYKDRLLALAMVQDMLKLLRRSLETNPKNDTYDSIDTLLTTESALIENASVRVSLTELSLLL